MMASTMMSMEKGQTEADLDFVRHSVLNSLRMYRSKYTDEYGELVICCDDRKSWRRDYFPLYKAGRKSEITNKNRLKIKAIKNKNSWYRK